MNAYRRLYKNHGDKIGYWEGFVVAPGRVVMNYATAEGAKETQQVYEATGKNIGKANETSPMDQAIAELESRTKKKLDKGYVTTLEAAAAPATNTLGLLRPMLATPLDKVNPESITWDQAFVQPKLDGHRCLFKDGVLYSREGKVIDLPHILEAIVAADMGHLHLDGEIYLHGLTLQQLSKLIKKHYDREQESSIGTLDLQYHIYDLVMDEPFRSRTSTLNYMFTTLPFVSPIAGGTLQPVRTLPVKGLEEVTELHTGFRSAGYEGTMLRFGDEPYRDGKRSRTLLKIKEFQDAEFTIVGVEEGKPYIRDTRSYQVPVWVCAAGNGETFTVTAPGTMEEKDNLWNNRERLIGLKLTVKYHYLSSEGIPQLPIALRFHETI